MFNWLATRWVVGAGFMAAALLAMEGVLIATWPLWLVLIFLHSPFYMIHQVEEHSGDRFRHFANERVFGGREGLTTNAVLVINLPVVWGLNLAALYAAAFISPGLGLIAPYAMLVNGITHIGAAFKLRSYNPGLVTAVAMFLPLSLATLYRVGSLPEVGWGYHALGLAAALVLHALIILDVMWRLRRA